MCDGKRAEDRALWLQQNKGMTPHAAQHQVMTEFPGQFKGIGAFIGGIVSAVEEGIHEAQTGWNPNAMCDGKRAEERAYWLQQNKGMSLDAAQHQVMREFPGQFNQHHPHQNHHHQHPRESERWGHHNEAVVHIGEIEVHVPVNDRSTIGDVIIHCEREMGTAIQGLTSPNLMREGREWARHDRIRDLEGPFNDRIDLIALIPEWGFDRLRGHHHKRFGHHW